MKRYVRSACLPWGRVRARGREDDTDVRCVELAGKKVRLRVARADMGEFEPRPELALNFGLQTDQGCDDVRALDLYHEGHRPLRNDSSVELCDTGNGWAHVLDFVEPHPGLAPRRMQQEPAEHRDLGAHARHTPETDRDVHRARLPGQSPHLRACAASTLR